MVRELLCVGGASQMQRSGLSLSPCTAITRTVISNMFQLLLCQEGFFSDFWDVKKRRGKEI